MQGPYRIEYDNHGNGGFSEWWDIFDGRPEAEATHIARCDDEDEAKEIVNALECHADLLEACEALHFALIRQLAGNNKHRNLDHNAVVAARAAIAKATPAAGDGGET